MWQQLCSSASHAFPFASFAAAMRPKTTWAMIIFYFYKAAAFASYLASSFFSTFFLKVGWESSSALYSVTRWNGRAVVDRTGAVFFVLVPILFIVLSAFSDTGVTENFDSWREGSLLINESFPVLMASFGCFVCFYARARGEEASIRVH